MRSSPQGPNLPYTVKTLTEFLRSSRQAWRMSFGWFNPGVEVSTPQLMLSQLSASQRTGGPRDVSAHLFPNAMIMTAPALPRIPSPLLAMGPEPKIETAAMLISQTHMTAAGPVAVRFRAMFFRKFTA